MKKSDKDYYRGVSDCILALASDDQEDAVRQIFRCCCDVEFEKFLIAENDERLIEILTNYCLIPFSV